MHTASFFTYAGPGRISIARYAPRGQVVVGEFRALAPGPWFNKVGRQRYEELFTEQLARLHPQRTWDELHAMAAGATPVLLCWENLSKPGEFCHRRMVAEWFGVHLGVEVTELPPSRVVRASTPKGPAPASPEESTGSLF